MQRAGTFSALVTIVLLTAGICPAKYSGGTGSTTMIELISSTLQFSLRTGSKAANKINI